MKSMLKRKTNHSLRIYEEKPFREAIKMRNEVHAWHWFNIRIDIFYRLYADNSNLHLTKDGLQIKHDFNGIATSSTGSESIFYTLLRESKPMSYKGLHINLSSPQEFNAEWPRISIPEYAKHINLPVNQQTR